jgi:hypothetical protein
MKNKAGRGTHMAEAEAMMRVTPLRATMSPEISRQACSRRVYNRREYRRWSLDHDFGFSKRTERSLTTKAELHHVPDILKRISSGAGGVSFALDFNRDGSGGGGLRAKRNASSDEQRKEYLKERVKKATGGGFREHDITRSVAPMTMWLGAKAMHLHTPARERE